MIKPVLKTFSLSLAALIVAASASAQEQNKAAQPALLSLESATIVCSTQADVDRGWEYQYELLEARQAAKGGSSVVAPGTIVTPPFENFAPYRVEGRSGRSARKTSKAAARQASEVANQF